ncbi:MAG TPA: SH3 domain-containing protein, partial [Armatimonadota bacterium]
MPAVANLTREPASGSELVSQVLLGTPVTPLAEQAGFTLCQTPDHYEGWVSSEELCSPAPSFVMGTTRRTLARIAYLRP